jgi:pSer/pThr/pTyr-binding forkhead associated (FHA) protein
LITDLGSSNGTFLNGKRIPANARIAASIGDRIQLGALENDPQGNSYIFDISFYFSIFKEIRL